MTIGRLRALCVGFVLTLLFAALNAMTPEVEVSGGSTFETTAIELDDAGRVTRMRGRWSPRSAVSSSADYTGAALDFVASQADLLGVPGYEPERLRFEPPLSLGTTTVVRARQTDQGLPLRASRVAFVFDAQGDLVSFRGPLWPASDERFGDPASLARLLSALDVDEGSKKIAMDSGFRVEDGSAAPLLLKRTFDPRRNEVVWIAERGQEFWLLDEAEGRVFESGQIESAFVENVQIRHRDDDGWLRTSDAPVSVIDHGNGQCTYRLEFNDPDNPPDWALHQIENKTAPYHPSYTVDCGSSPDFTETAHEILIQQHVYYWIQKARSYAIANAFDVVDRVGGLFSGRLGVSIKPPGWQDICPFNNGSSPGCFTYVPEPLIALKDNGTEPATHLIFHEFAHYMVYAYGLYSPEMLNCNENGQGMRVNETIGNVFGHILRYELVGADFFAPESLVVIHHESQSEGKQFVPGAAGCVATSGNYSMGTALEMAVREILSDRNCNEQLVDPATGLSGCEREGAIGWDDREDASQSMLGGLAYALSLSPSAMRFEDIAEGIVEWLELERDPAIADRVRRVFAHHAILGTSPIGAIESVDPNFVSGWACDRDTPSRPVEVTVEIELENGQRIPLNKTLAVHDSSADPSIKVQCEGGEAHRFLMPVPRDEVEAIFASQPFDSMRARVVVHDTDMTLRAIASDTGLDSGWQVVHFEDADGDRVECDTSGNGLCSPSGVTDNCPDVANTSQLDQDGDGIGDACDTPPLLAPTNMTVAKILSDERVRFRWKVRSIQVPHIEGYRIWSRLPKAQWSMVAQVLEEGAPSSTVNTTRRMALDVPPCETREWSVTSYGGDERSPRSVGVIHTNDSGCLPRKWGR